MRNFSKCCQAKPRIVIVDNTIITLAIVRKEVAIHKLQVTTQINSNYFNNFCCDLLICTEVDANLDKKHLELLLRGGLAILSSDFVCSVFVVFEFILILLTNSNFQFLKYYVLNIVTCRQIDVSSRH